MKKILQKHISVIPAILFFLSTFCGWSQQVIQDTIAQTQAYKQEAEQALVNYNYNTAIVSLVNANSLITGSEYEELKGDIKLRLSQLYYTLQSIDKAQLEAKEAVRIYTALGNELELAKANNQLALILIHDRKFSQAKDYAQRANRIFTRLGDEQGKSRVLFSLGMIEKGEGNHTSAINYFDAASDGMQDESLRYDRTRVLLNKAEAYSLLKGGDPGENIAIAHQNLDQAVNLIDQAGYFDLKATSYRIRSYLALKENNYLEAEKNLEIYERKNDSLYQVYLEAVSQGVDAESQLSALNAIIEDQQDDLDKKQKSINFGRMTTGLSIALIVILSLLTLSLYKNNNLRAKANELLQDKNNELQLAKEKAEKASLAKAQFLSTITHELRTPLYAVTGLTHLLLEENPKQSQMEHLNSLKFSGEYLLSLINNILDLNKLEANKVEIERTKFNLKKRVNDVLIALKKSAEDRKNNLHLEFDERIPDKLMGDPLKLSQILINLVGNSVKFTQNGDVTVRVKQMDANSQNVNLRIEVEDNGVGISKKKQKSIFESFSQASLQINRKFGGTGLGLSIVKNLLELLGSKIYLESQLGKGSKFWFDIKLDQADDLIPEINNTRNIIYDVDYVALENRNVLVVEDNKINQMITKKILEKNKISCMVADNGMDAIELVKTHNFDVVLMDIHMPGISGIEATQKIRTFNTQIPIIALTAVTIDENLDDFYKAGFNEIIPKPFKTEEFFEKIYRTLHENKQLV
ncbi:hybrid sensor histidine kinase/response regulator [Aureitalea marina]|uniref:histidine kinase n=1 Tax=Aureitalea marina TaxID=930804 RepID=A0A2S7KME4_9FLAO|nr:ATP-binding protein [Aureitalea marina]PQB03760.1 hypothetical protein BST85_01710 [Aureitalea marina]